VSLSEFNKVSEEGVAFRSHLDGNALFLSPEKAVEIQQALGSDIMMALDRPIAATSSPAEVEAALALTTRWAIRCKAERSNAARRKDARSAAEAPGERALFGIVQGGTSAPPSASTATRWGG
jgi:queuine tRNA-ribosyltransferase